MHHNKKITLLLFFWVCFFALPGHAMGAGTADDSNPEGTAPNGETLTSGSEDRTVRLWKLDGSLIAECAGHRGYVYALSLTPDGQTLASGANEEAEVIVIDNLKRARKR